jgi:fido (protein-threonine AMPylation protein)
MSSPGLAPASGSNAQIANSEALCAFHASICGPDDRSAGRFRTCPRMWLGYAFAQPEMIEASIDRRFSLLDRAQYFRPLARSAFFDVLALHISELFAISPFASGNRRLIYQHAAQLAAAAGYEAAFDAVGTGAWDEALRLAFVHHDHRALSCLLKGDAIPAALFPAPLTGIAGLPVLPTRDAPRHRRYLRTMARAKRTLELNLTMAKQQATEAYQQLLDNDAAPQHVAIARSELAFLRSEQGPLFQADLLEACGYAQITPALNPDQSPLDIVREIAAAIMVGLNQQPVAQLEQLMRAPERLNRQAGGSPHQERLAFEFLSNTASENQKDLRFASWQRFVDQAASRVRTLCGGDPQKIAAETKATRLHAADRIRHGDMKATPQRRRTSSAVQ